MLILSDDVENTGFPVINWVLIFINVLVFFAVVLSGQNTHEVFGTWGTVPNRFFTTNDFSQMQAILSSMFLHSGYLHLIGNMWALYLFGDNVEERMGHFTYLLFYITCGFIADFIHILSDPTSAIPAVGASGAIAGVMGAYVVLHPKATCKTWWGDDSFFFAFRTYQIPASLIIFGWFLLQVAASVFTSGCEVAFFAHIGGFLAGIALLCFVRYREYQSNRIETVSYGGALPAVCLTALMVLAWTLLSHIPASKTIAVQALSRPTSTVVSKAEETTQSTAKTNKQHNHEKTKNISNSKSSKSKTQLHKTSIVRKSGHPSAPVVNKSDSTDKKGDNKTQ